MKRQIGIWMDTDKAVLINLTNEDEGMTIIESQIETRTRYAGERKPHGKMASMLINPTTKSTNRFRQQQHSYFSNIISKINGASELFVFGPSLVKVEFEKELRKHPLLTSLRVELENKGKLTERQMVAHVRSHFHH
ncbi:MAG: hypothetical protein QM786_09440 [Breznakibacter sp.]